jgi:dynein heavy chain
LLGERNKNKLTWAAGQKMMNQPAKFIERLQNFDKNDIPPQVINDLEPILSQPYFNKKTMMGKSEAAANLCNFIVNVVRYNKIWRQVEPLMQSADEAEKLANEKLEELRIVQEKVAEIVAKVNELKANLQAAEDKKAFVVGEAEKLQ